MPFEKGRKKTGGKKLGHQNKATKAEAACERAGIDPFDLLVKAAQAGEISCLIQLCKHIEPPKKPLDVSLNPEKNRIEVIVRDYGSKDRD
jgi:hypothetical protein